MYRPQKYTYGYTRYMNTLGSVFQVVVVSDNTAFSFSFFYKHLAIKADEALHIFQNLVSMETTFIILITHTSIHKEACPL